LFFLHITGVPGDLFYCRNGVVNDYALTFNLPIKNEITEIYFNWHNEPPLGLQQPDLPVRIQEYDNYGPQVQTPLVRFVVDLLWIFCGLFVDLLL
jgi:WIF domain